MFEQESLQNESMEKYIWNQPLEHPKMVSTKWENTSQFFGPNPARHKMMVYAGHVPTHFMPEISRGMVLAIMLHHFISFYHRALLLVLKIRMFSSWWGTRFLTWGTLSAVYSCKVTRYADKSSCNHLLVGFPCLYVNSGTAVQSPWLGAKS